MRFNVNVQRAGIYRMEVDSMTLDALVHHQRE